MTNTSASLPTGEIEVTLVRENEDGSGVIDINFPNGEVPDAVVSAGVLYIIMKSALGATSDDEVSRWIARGKQEEETDRLMEKMAEVKAQREKDMGFEYY